MALASNRPLIVSQQMIIAADLYLQMGKLNYDVIGISNSSNEALATIKVHTPSVVLIDLNLKGAVDGIKLSQIVKSEFNIPVIFLNPGMDIKTIDRAFQTKPSSFMQIPYESKDLKLKIEFAAETRRFQSSLCA
jgi:DNA-binding NtrC family response regulator